MMNVRRVEDTPRQLKTLLELPNIIPYGRCIGIDMVRLCFLGMEIKEWVELRDLVLAHDQTLKSTTLAYSSEVYLKLIIDKFGQTADYSMSPLSPNLIEATLQLML